MTRRNYSKLCSRLLDKAKLNDVCSKLLRSSCSKSGVETSKGHTSSEEARSKVSSIFPGPQVMGLWNTSLRRPGLGICRDVRSPCLYTSAWKFSTSTANWDQGQESKVTKNRGEIHVSKPLQPASTSESAAKVKESTPAKPGGASLSRKPHDISLERNFITPLRAMNDFLLTPADLEGMRKTLRRSAHADEPPITVYWRKDIEAKALEVWGSYEVLNQERRKREQELNELQEATFQLRKIMKQYRKSYPENEGSTFSSLFSGSGKIVITAVAINGSNFVIKLIAWVLTGSHSLFAEAIHSLADTINQLILVYGIHKSTQRANVDHPYGYANMRHVASLVSGVGIFCVGAGLSFYHGIIGLMTLQPLESLYYAFFVLGGSLVSEGATLFMALNSVRKRCKELNITTKEFILRSVDPAINVVIMEDSAAVAGVAVAAACMGLTALTGSPIPDAVGSLFIGGILGGVASFIIYTNATALVGRSIPREALNRINNDLEQDVMIRAIHDVKGIDMGNSLVRYKAEVDFDGRELTRAYLEKSDMQKLFEEIKTIQNKEEFEQFMLKHGEAIVDTLGAEIDRIEQKLKKSHPEIRHCDLEIL